MKVSLIEVNTSWEWNITGLNSFEIGALSEAMKHADIPETSSDLTDLSSNIQDQIAREIELKKPSFDSPSKKQVMKNIKEIYKAINDGDPLTDAECEYGITYFGEVSHRLSELGPEFRHAFTAALRAQYQLESFLKARKK
jgi:hypothetical protein